MKIAIVYATKSGITAKAARALNDALVSRGFEPLLFDLAAGKPQISAFDAVALGASIRMGQWRRKARRFAKKNRETLLAKPLALFACRFGSDELRALLAKQADAELAAHAVFADSLGGLMDPETLHGFEKRIAQSIIKGDQTGQARGPGILAEQVNACADALAGALRP